MANCGPCLKLGLQLMAHYPANKAKGKDAECYYHHFGMPLPASIQAKIAQPTKAEDRAAEVPPEKTSDPAPKKADLRVKGVSSSGTTARAGLTPDVCEECWADGHACPAHCTVDKQRLCIDCADGKPCAIAREKAANPRTPAHERYHVTIPGQKKPRAADVQLLTDDRGIVVRVERTAVQPVPHPTKKVNMSLVLDKKDLPTRAICTPAKPPVQVPTAGKNQQQEKKEKPSMSNPTQPSAASANGKDHTAPASVTATIIVTEKHMDAFWAKLSLQEKAAIFQRQLEGV